MKQTWLNVLACVLTLGVSNSALATTYQMSSVAPNFISSAGHTAIAAWANNVGCVDTVGDDSLSAPIDIGFTFRYGAATFTQVRINTNGRVQFNNTYCTYGTAAVGPPRTYTNPVPDANLNNMLRIYGADLDVSSVGAGTVTYATVGSAPNRVFVVTWNNVSAWREGGAQNVGAGTSYNLQIQLYENGDFYFQYGNSDNVSEPSNTTIGPAQIAWQIDVNDYAVVQNGLPANNTAYKFTLGTPFAEYRMDEGPLTGAAGEIADSSGNAHNATRVSSPASATPAQTTASGKVCRGLDVPSNGDTAHIDAANTGFTPSAIGSQGSIAFWWRDKNDWNGQDNYLFDATTQASKFFYLGKRNNSRLRFELTDNASTPVTVAAETANTGIAASTWKHVAVTWQVLAGASATVLNIYLDGVSVATATGTTSGVLNGTLGTLYIGDNRSAASNGLTGNPTSANGTIDEFRVYSRVLTQADVQSVMAATRNTCPNVGPAKFLINHSGYGINCRVEPITVSAVDGFNALVGTYAGAVTLTTQSGRGTWSLVSGTGTLVDAPADDGLATYQFQPADGGRATFGLYYPAGATPIDVDVYQTDNVSIRDDDSEGVLAFSASGFTMTSTAVTNPPQNPLPTTFANEIAGSNFTVYLTAYGQTPTDPECGVIEAYAGNHALSFWMDHLNPTPGVLNATVNGVGVGPAEATAVNQTIAFAAGQASVIAKYKDVGQIRLAAKDASALPSAIRGQTTAFVVKPAALAVSKVETLGGVANPGAATATGAAFVAAGTAFRVEVEARDAEGSLTPSYGLETPAEGIRVSSAALVVPAAGRNGSSGVGTLGGATAFVATATAGRFRDDAVTFDEMGIVRLSAAVSDGDYLGAGAVAASTSGNVGRFYPARFDLIAGSAITPSCGTFTYMDQSTLGIAYRLEAHEAAGGRTWNYDEALLGANAVATMNVVAENADAGNDLGARLTGVTSPWSSGAVAVSSAAAKFARAALADGPFDALMLGVKATDPLGNTVLANANMNAATTGNCASAASCNAVQIGAATSVRYGRLMVLSAFGPEDRALSVPLEAQYFDGALFARNALDGCTTYAKAQSALSNFGGNLGSGETSVTTPSSAIALVSGDSNVALPLLLAAPGFGNDGSVDVTFTVPSYLEFDWLGTGNRDPVGTARFGRYRGHDRIIFWRER